jgi:transcriptional regulator with XRE-family HTH domain
MKSRGVSANALSRATGVSQPTISRILNGESKDPDTATLEPIAQFFGRTVAELRGENTMANVIAKRVVDAATQQSLSADTIDALRPRLRELLGGHLADTLCDQAIRACEPSATQVQPDTQAKIGRGRLT